MATNSVIPAAAPPAAAPAAATAPTSSPSSTGTSTPAGVPATQHMPDGQQGSGALSHDQQVDAMVAAFEKKPAPVVETTKPADTEAGTSTGNKVETPAVEEKPAAEATQETTQQEDTGYNFDEDNFVGARDLASKLDAIEGARALLGDDLCNDMLANARIAEQLAPYREIFGSPEEAKVVAKAAQDFSAVQATFQSITPENVQKGTSDLLNTMLQMSAFRDENGEPRRRADGTYITDGTTTRFLNELFDRKFNTSIVKKIEASGDEAAKAALDLVMERAGLRASTADKTETDPALAARKAELDQRENSLREQQETGRKQAAEQYTKDLNSDLETASKTAFDKLLAPATALDKLTRTAVLTQLSKAVKAAILADSAYQIEKRAIQAKPMTAARKQEEVALANRWMATKLSRVAKPILAEAGIAVSKKAASREAEQAAREQAARGEVNGGTAAASKPAAANPAQARAQVVDALKTKLGRNPSDQEVLTEMMMSLPGIKGRAA